VVRPHDAERLAPVLLAVARIVELRHELTNARGSEAVLRSRLEDLTDANTKGLQPFALFKRALEVELKRARRYKYPLAVAMFAVVVPPPAPPPGVPGILRARAGNTLIHAIRDIDLATEIDQERFLVLLPYTELTGAAGLARRVIEAVGKGQPVVAMGRSFAPQLVGAVAGAKPGQQLSFGKLMKDVTRALEQARADGAELAVAT
jgi:PleD family two-component response regulator